MAIYKFNDLFGLLDMSSLKHFYSIVKFGGFSKAARATKTSQPALSLGLQKLEKNIGMILVDRSSKDFSLTDSGFKLFAFCQQIEGIWENAALDLGAKQLTGIQQIRLGVAYAIGFQPVLAILDHSAARNEKHEYEITSNASHLLISELVSGAIDAAILPDDVHDPRVSVKKLSEDQIIFVASSKLKKTWSSKNWRQSLKALTLINYPRETPLRALVDQLCNRQSLEFRSRVSIDGIEGMKLLTGNHIGATFILKSLVKQELNTKSIEEIKLPFALPKRGMILATRRDKTGLELASLLMSLMKNKIKFENESSLVNKPIRRKTMNKMTATAILGMMAASLIGCASTKEKAQAPVAPAEKSAVAQVKPPSPNKETSQNSVLSCKKDKDIRSLQVIKKDNGCELNYTKFKASKVVASSSNSEKHCVDAKMKIQEKLKKSGFTCEEAS
jgi:DNA-binding transcriptional LysR family regulator